MKTLLIYLYTTLLLYSSNEFKYIQPDAVEYGFQETPVDIVKKDTHKKYSAKSKEVPLKNNISNNIIDKIKKVPKLPKPSIRKEDDKRTLSIEFENKSDIVVQNTTKDVEELADFLKNHKRYQVIIYAFTDSIGSEQENKILSKKRADKVKKLLIGYGVSSTKLTAIGRGELEPIASNMYKTGRAQNRRVEIELIK